jgi:hypothetical protein
MAGMSSELPAEIEVEDQGPNGVRLRLPHRRLGGFRWVGLGLVIVGTVILGCLLTIVAAFSQVLPVFVRPWMFFPVAFLGIPTLGGAIPLWWGFAVLGGRRELIVRGNKLRAVERVGVFRYGKSWPLASVSRLHVTSLVPVTTEHPPAAWAAGMDALVMFSTGSERRMLAWGYPQTILEPVARALAKYVERAAELTAETSDVGEEGEQRKLDRAKQVRVTSDYHPETTSATHYDDDDDPDDDDFDDEPLPDLRIKPAESKIELEEFEDGLTIKVPPGGLLRGTSGLFAFSLIWNGALAGITTCGVIGILNNPQQADKEGWVAALFISVFWLVGIAILLASINMGRRKAAIAIAGDALMVIQSGPFGTKRKEWLLPDVSAVRVGPSGMKVNDVDVVELQIVGADDKKFGMLAGRKDAELGWLAHVLQQKVTALARLRDVGEETGTE